MMDEEIVIRPIQFSWFGEWLPRVRSCYPRMRYGMDAAADGDVRAKALAAASAIGTWQKETREWLEAMSPEKKEDIIQLLFSECELLWMVIDPGHQGISKPAHGGMEWSDFRERYYDGIPLA